MNIMNMKRLITLLAYLSLLAACQQQDGAETAVMASVDKADAVAMVNGKYISKKALTRLKQELNQRMPNHTLSDDQLVDELIKRGLLVEQARKKKLDQTPEFAETIETYKMSLLAQLALQDFFKKNEITDADLKAEYAKQTAPGSNSEYKARHILVKTEDEAKKIIAQLDAGSDFAKLAKKLSIGPSGPNGGDLGWLIPSQMVAPFSEAVIALENTKYTAEPVTTKFGFHIILREDSREKAVPDFEAVKAQLIPLIQRQKRQNFIGQLREQATIEIIKTEVVPEPSPMPATATAEDQ